MKYAKTVYKGGRHYAPGEQESSSSGVLNYIPAFVFAAFIFTMAIWFIFGAKHDYSSSEKRPLQAFPDTSLENIASGKFGKDFETYFADQFPARNLWVGVNAYTALAEFNNGAGGIYNCKNDYLINKPVAEPNNLEKNVQAVIDFKNADAVKNIPFTVLFAPSTGYICEDVLPAVHDKYKDDEYFTSSAASFSQNGIQFVDVREYFKSLYVQGNQLYYRTDHHWTTKGAFAAYEQLCQALGMTPVNQDSLKKESFGGFYGTTYSSSGFWLTPPDDIEIWSDPSDSGQNIRVKITEGTETKEYDSVFFYDHLKEDDKYPVFIDGNHAYTEITNTNASGGTVLVVKDSFSHSMAPFLAHNFKKVILVDMRYFKGEPVSSVVQRENPDKILVLYGIDNISTDTDLVWIK